MIYDCFSFFNELVLLEIRRDTLNKVVKGPFLPNPRAQTEKSHDPFYSFCDS